MADIEVARAVVTIVPTMEGAQQSITEQLTGAASSSGVADAGKKAGSTFAGGLAKGVGVAAGAVTAVAGAAVGASKSFVSAAGDVASYGDNIDKMSQKMGISAEAYQEWDAVLQHSGTSIESLKGGMKVLNNTMADAGNVINETLAAEAALDDQLDNGTISLDEYNAAYDKLYESAYDSLGPLSELGFSMMDIQEMSQDSDLALEKVITALQGMPEGAERAALAQDLLGRSAQEMGALLNTSAEDTQAMRDRVHELGGVMSNDAVKNAAAFQDSLQDMQTSLSGFGRAALTEALPGLTGVMDGLTALFTGDTEEGLAMISQSIDTLVAQLTEKLPELLQVGLGIVEALATAIMDNLPALADAALQLLGTFATFVIENLPTIIDVALNILLAVANGIIENLPVLIPAVVDVILTIVDKLTQPDMIVQLVNAALQIIIALTEGIIKALPQLIARVPEIIINIVKALVAALPMIFEAAVQLIGTLIEGIVSCFGTLMQKGTEIIDTIKDGIHQKIEDAKNWGKDLIKNFIEGIKGKWNDLKDSIKGVGEIISDRLHFSEPDVGPLSNFHTWAPDMMDLFAQGITDNLGVVQGAMGLLTGMIGGDMTATVAAVGVSGAALDASDFGSGAGAGGDVVIPVYIGNEKIDELVVRATQRANYRSGGR